MCRSRHPHLSFVRCALAPFHKKAHAAIGTNPGQYIGNQPVTFATRWPNRADDD